MKCLKTIAISRKAKSLKSKIKYLISQQTSFIINSCIHGNVNYQRIKENTLIQNISSEGVIKWIKYDIITNKNNFYLKENHSEIYKNY